MTQLLCWNSSILPTNGMCLTPPLVELQCHAHNFLRERIGIQSHKFKRWEVENCDFHVLNYGGELALSQILTLLFSSRRSHRRGTHPPKCPLSNLKIGMLTPSLAELLWEWNQIPPHSHWHGGECIMSLFSLPWLASLKKFMLTYGKNHHILWSN